MPIRRIGVVLLIALLSLPLALTAMLSSAGAMREAQGAEVTVHVNLCVAAGCTELPEAIEPASGVEVTLSSVDDGSVLGTCVTGGAGTCVIPLAQVPGQVTVSLNPDTVPAGYVADVGAAPYVLEPQTPEVLLLLYPADGVLEPPPAQDEPDPTVAPPVTQPTTVPAGDNPVPLPLPIQDSFPASLYAGSCADLESATSAEPLTDLVIVDGDHRGSLNAVVAASSYSVVPVPMADILAGGYAIGVMNEEQTLIACGELGGPLDQQGTFSVGLVPEERASAAGVAYVAPMGDDQVAISAFIVPQGMTAAPWSTPLP